MYKLEKFLGILFDSASEQEAEILSSFYFYFYFYKSNIIKKHKAPIKYTKSIQDRRLRRRKQYKENIKTKH